MKQASFDEKAFDVKAAENLRNSVSKNLEQVEAVLALAESDIQSLVGVLSDQEKSTLDLWKAVIKVRQELSPENASAKAKAQVPKSIFQSASKPQASILKAPSNAASGHGSSPGTHGLNVNTFG